MKNLQVIKTNLINLADLTLGFCVDADNGILYVVKRCLEIVKISRQEHYHYSLSDTVQHNLDPALDVDNISLDDVKLIEFVVECGSILIALRSGSVLKIAVSLYSSPSDVLYKHHSHITSIRLSPDQDLIALADVTNDIYIIGLDGHILHKQNTLSQSDSLHKPVGVGWGSKETQFFGLDGRPSKEKQLSDQIKMTEAESLIIDKIESSEEYKKFRARLEKNTIIDWRGDGQFLATLTFMPEVMKHYLKVWNRNLELQYMSDQLVTIERDLLTWVPNGHFVCCAQRRDGNVNEVAMFEKNGLVHQRITLPSNLGYIFIKEMVWSPNSKVLAIVVHKFVLDQDRLHFEPILLLYTMQNFHYYLKFSSKLVRNHYYTIRWNPINHYKLHLISDHGLYHEYICNFEVSYSNEQSTVAVIDSNKVLITPLQICCIPPPMTAITLEVRSPIYSLALNHHKNTDIFIFTTDDKLVCTNSNIRGDNEFYDILKIHYDTHLPVEKLDLLTKSYRRNCAMYNLNNVHTLQNFIPIDSHNLIATQSVDSGSEVVRIKLFDMCEGPNDVKIETIAKLENQIVAISRPTKEDWKDIVIVESDGNVVVLDITHDKLQKLFKYGSSYRLNFIELQSLESRGSISLLALFHDMTLSFNDNTLLSTSCTSFRLTDNYLIYTTTENLMHFLLLDHLWTGTVDDTCSQPIEVGATLIVASEDDAKVVLQMPRGNLEIIHPRILILSSLTQLLDREDYVRAMQMARRHRVNMNFICDYLLKTDDYSMMIIKKFALSVASYDPQLLLIFLTELDEEDTISGRYGTIMKHLPTKAFEVRQKPGADFCKIQKVCTSIDLPSDQNYLQPTLLSLLKQTPRKTCEALKIVARLDKQSQRAALEFMLYFIRVDQLFMDALRTYNTDIALMVANVSHKDPKEYLALLDEFNNEKSNLLRAYKIDMHTKHYGDGFAKLFEFHELQDIQNVETHNLLREIAASNKIFKQALCCFTSTSKDVKLFEELWSDYGVYLLGKRCYLEAGLAFSKAFELDIGELDYFNKALNCFSLANKSENVLALMYKLTDQDQMVEIVISRLMEENKSTEAIALLSASKLRQSGLESFGLSNETHMRFMRKMVDKSQWYLVDFMFPKRYADDRIRDTIIEHIKNSVQIQISTWTDELEVVKQQFTRLKELLVTHKSRAANENNGSNYNFISDSLSTIDGSEVSSTISGSNTLGPPKSSASSIKTRNSSRSNKSQLPKKKRINLKPGSRYEDLALALELRRYILRQRNDESETMRLLAGSFEYCYSTRCPEDDWSRKVSTRLNELLAEQFALRQVMCSLLWPDSPLNEQMFSLYRRFSGLLSEDGRTYENEEFEVLVRPELPKVPLRFEL